MQITEIKSHPLYLLSLCMFFLKHNMISLGYQDIPKSFKTGQDVIHQMSSHLLPIPFCF